MNDEFLNAKSTQRPGGTLARLEAEAEALGKAADAATFNKPASSPKPLSTPPTKPAPSWDEIEFPKEEYAIPDRELSEDLLRMLLPHAQEPLVTEAELRDLEALDNRQEAVRKAIDAISPNAVHKKHNDQCLAHEAAIRAGQTPGPIWSNEAYSHQKQLAADARKELHGEIRSVRLLKEAIVNRIIPRLESAAWAAAKLEKSSEVVAAARWKVRYEPSHQLCVLVWVARHGMRQSREWIFGRPAAELRKLFLKD